MPRDKVIPAATVLEEIQSVVHYPDGRVDIVVGLGEMVDELDMKRRVIGSIFAFFPNQQLESMSVSGEDFVSIMSEAPAWNPSKKAGQFGIDDAWTAVDAKRGGVPLKDYVKQGG